MKKSTLNVEIHHFNELTMKKITRLVWLLTFIATATLTSCSRNMDAKTRKIKTTENKTEGYLYYQNDQNMKGDSTVKKSPGN